MASVAKRKWRSPDGTDREAWTCRYMDERGVHRQRTFPTKKLADAHRRKVEREMEEGVHIAQRESLTIAEGSVIYLEALDRRVKEGTARAATYRKEESHLRLHVLPALGNRRLAELTADEADQFFASVRKRFGSTETVAAVFASLSRLIDFGKRRRWVAVNVARDVRLWPENRLASADKVRTFDTDEARRLFLYFENPREHNKVWTPRYAAMGRCIVYLGMFAGLRSGEIRGLPWAAIDFDNGTITIAQQVDETGKIAPPKTRASVRVVPVPDLILDELKAWKRFAVENKDGFVFTSKKGTAISASGLHTNIWRRALVDLGYSADDPGGWPHFHALRHFATSIMIQHMPAADAAPLLGHKNVTTTLKVYSGATMTAIARRSSVQNMAAALLPQPEFANA